MEITSRDVTENLACAENREDWFGVWGFVLGIWGFTLTVNKMGLKQTHMKPIMRLGEGF